MGVFSDLNEEKKSKYEKLLKEMNKSPKPPQTETPLTNSKIDELNQTISSLKEEIDEKLETVQKDAEILYEKRQQNSELRKKIQRKTRTVDELTGQRDLLESKIQQLRQQSENIESNDLQKSEIEFSNLQKQEDLLIQEIQNAKNKLRVTQKELEGIEDEKSEFAKKNRFVEDMHQSIITYRNQLLKISSDRANLELEIKRQMSLLDAERKKEQDIIKNISSEFRN